MKPTKSTKRPSRKATSARSSKKDLAPRANSVKGGEAAAPLASGVITNLANMRHEMLKSVANNLRA